jgi:exodeoxyribonuclease V beta subunit
LTNESQVEGLQHLSFDPKMPLDDGITLIEASAGTGKTYSIVHCIMRLVSEYGCSMQEILVITFTKAATAQLQNRIRKRLLEFLHALRRPEETNDKGLRILCEKAWEGGDTLVRDWCLRVAQAIGFLDQASISTIHSFCYQQLKEHAFKSGLELELELEPETELFSNELIDDYLSQRFSECSEPELRVLREHGRLKKQNLVSLLNKLWSYPDATLVPAWENDSHTPTQAIEMLTEFRHLWLSSSVGLKTLVDKACADKLLNASTYQLKKTQVNWQSIQTWAGSERYDLLGISDPTWLYFSQGRLLDKAKNDLGPGLSQHPLAQHLDDVLTFLGHLASAEALRFCRYARHRMRNQQLENGHLTYNDLLVKLQHVLDSSDSSLQLVDAIRSKYRAALVDEFQDTDHLQWSILKKLFDHPKARLFLIGDPKQSIYSFRNANVQVYLAAKKSAEPERRLTMSINYRSSKTLVEGMNRLMEPGHFFEEEGVDYIRIDAAPDAQDNGLSFPPNTPEQMASPFQFCLVYILSDLKKPIRWSSYVSAIARRCAEDISNLLQSRALVTTSAGERHLDAGDIAVLVRSHSEARSVHRACMVLGLHAVIRSKTKVFQTSEAHVIYHWLLALQDSHGEASAKVVAGSVLFGWSSQRLRQPVGESWDLFLHNLTQDRQGLADIGIFGSLKRALERENRYEAILGCLGGERVVTNLFHVAELVHEQATLARLGLAGMISWLEKNLSGAVHNEAAELRLESDQRSLQIVTIHQAKGLEYEVVFIPFLAAPIKLKAGLHSTVYSSPTADEPTRYSIHMAYHLSSTQKTAAKNQLLERERQEALRLSYVALTRAKSRVVTYVAPHKEFIASPLAKLFGEDKAQGSGIGTDDFDVDAWRENLISRLGVSCFNFDWDPGRQLCTVPEAEKILPHLETLQAKRRQYGGAWGQTSYSSLIHARTRHAKKMASSLQNADLDEGHGVDHDQTEGPSWAVNDENPSASMDKDVPLSDFPSGPLAGNCLHEIYENLDFQLATQDNAMPYVKDLAAKVLPSYGFSPEILVPKLIAGLCDTLRTPLGGPLGYFCLESLSASDRINELRFDMPVCSSKGPIRPEDLAACFEAGGEDEVLCEEDFQRFRELSFAPFEGFMTGYIDLIFRVPSQEGVRYFVADYKSNRLTPFSHGRCVLGGYTFTHLREQMRAHDYTLQYHLYILALHRFLKSRLGSSYDYDRCMGGAYYLFIRGMNGEREVGGKESPGIFYHKPKEVVIDALDTLFGVRESGGQGA